MAGSFSNEYEPRVLNHIFKGTALAQHTNLYIALSNSTLTETCFGTNLRGEISGGGYGRKQCNTWLVSNGTASNNIAFSFTQATNLWGTIETFAICTHKTTGDVICYGTLTTSKKIGTNDTAKFATGDINVTLT